MKKIIFFTLLLYLPISTLAQDRKSEKKEIQKKTDSFMNTLSADYLDRDYEKGVINLKGKVNFTFGNKKLSADSAEIWYKSKLIVASGNAEIASDSFAMQGERIEYDYGNDVGNIYKGQVKSGKVTFKGEKLEKKGESDFSADYGVYTACDCDPPTWSFSGYSIDAGVGSYAYVKWPVLRIGHLPVFALPYIVVPLKSSRQTGLLLPTYETTTQGGSTLGEGFFWAINQSQDSTLTLKNYELRGLKTLLEYRQRYSQNSLIEMNGGFLSDSAVDKIPRYLETDNKGKEDREYERWYFKTSQYLELPDNYTQRIHLNLVSDLQYILDFPTELGGTGEPALENHYSLTKKNDDNLLVVDSTMHTNLLKTESIYNNNDAVHRLPEIRFSMLERPIGNSGFSLKLDSTYVNFARSGFAWDDVCYWGKDPLVEGGNNAGCLPEDKATNEFLRKKKQGPDGDFDPDYDFLRTGQRFDFQPTISYTFHAGALDIVPSISYRETFYQFPVSEPDFASTISRRYLQTQISSRFKAYRIYEGKESKVKHEMVPEIMWTNTPLIYQPDHKFFGSRSTSANFRQNQSISDVQDFYGDNKLQFDYNDRIYDRSLMTFMLANKIIRKRVYNSVNDYKQIGTIRIWQTYDFIEASRIRAANEGTNKPWSEISTLFDFRFDNFETNSLFKYFPYHNVINSSVRMKVFSDFGNFAEVTYTQDFKPSDTKTDIDYPARNESISPRIGFISKYLNLAGGPDYNFVSRRIISWTADIGIKPPGNCILLGIQIVNPSVDAGVTVSAKFNMSFDGT